MTPENILRDSLLTEKQVATLLNLSLGTIRRRRLLQQAPKATKIGGSVRYKPSDIAAFLEACPTIGGQGRGY